ncbi:MAG: ABC transporter substrate-binding protein, partial [Egibacteraceae bacterium]
FGTEEQAARAMVELRERVATVEERNAVPEGSEAAVLQVYDEGPLAGYGNRSPVHAQMQKLGLKNAFADVDEFYFEPSVEELTARDPDVLITLFGYRGVDSADDAKAELLARSEISGLTALREDNIVAVNYQYTGAGYLAVEGLEIMAEQLAALQ